MMGRKDTTNYYEVLEVRSDAPQGEIFRAYQRAKSTYSVDNPALYSMFSQEEARELLKVIEEAYSVLSNVSLRKNYDDNFLNNRSAVEKNIESFMAGHDISDVAPAPAKSNYSQNFKAEIHEKEKFKTVEMTDDYVIRKRDSAAALPEGMGKTSLSTYKIDTSKEEEFAKVESFDGSILKSIREYKNLSIERISDATRISRTYLTAVEQNDYRELPAPVFVRGFIVQIARILNLNENKVANSYLQIYKSKQK
jgi:curved DNA-binding protein CbpA